VQFANGTVICTVHCVHLQELREFGFSIYGKVKANAIKPQKLQWKSA
jgi:hypothetical protein